MTSSLWLALFATFWVGGAALVARRLQASWFAPAPLAAAYWVVAIDVSLVFFPGAVVTLRSVCYLSLAVSAWMVGSLCGVGSRRPPRSVARVAAPAPQFRTACVEGRGLFVVTLAGGLSGVVAAQMAARQAGAGLGSFLSLSSLLQTGNELSVLRYSGNGGHQGIVSGLLAVGFASTLVGQFNLFSTRRSYRLASILPLLGILSYSAITTARLPFLIGIALSVGGYLGAHLCKNGDFPKLSVRRLALLAGVVVGAASAFSAIAFVRVGSLSPRLQVAVFDKLQVYAFGYLPGFSAWLEGSEGAASGGQPLGLGTSTLAGVEFITGQDRSATRAYDQFVTVGQHNSPTNIYTALRGLILDFGFPGALIVLAVAGFVAARLFEYAKLSRSPVACVAYAGVFSTIALSQTLSILSFTNVLLGMVFAAAAARLLDSRRAQESAPRPPQAAAR